MSNFLDVIRARIDGCYIENLKSYLPVRLVDDHNLKIDKIIDKLDSLGENARRLLEIGIVQDRLVELGFRLEPNHIIRNTESYRNKINSMENDGFHTITFWHDVVRFNEESFYYTSRTWQDDLINSVKELIDDK